MCGSQEAKRILGWINGTKMERRRLCGVDGLGRQEGVQETRLQGDERAEGLFSISVMARRLGTLGEGGHETCYHENPTRGLGTIIHEFFGYSYLTPVSLVVFLSLLIYIDLFETRVQEGASYLVLDPYILLNTLLSPRNSRNAQM